jgi:pyroglutamyl-peptidase
VSSREAALSHASCALVMGFGPFGEVRRNPAAELACAVDGTRVGDTRVVGRSMPVSYQRSVEHTAAAWARHRPGVVLGVGVATSKNRPELERVARASWASEPLDIDGRTPA